jgi:hypothetical protein
VGSLPYKLAADLRDRLGLERAVETGTFQGGGARALAAMFSSVVTIELSDRYFERASAELAGVPNIIAEHGASPEVLQQLEPAPSFYWLDAHWSGLDTAGEENPCPVLEEIEAIPAHSADCVLIDDARLFAATREPDKWPTLVRVLDALREARPTGHVTVLHDLILCVPPEAKDIVDDFGMDHAEEVWAAGEGARLAGSELAIEEPSISAPRRLRQLVRYAAGRRS